MGIEPPPSAHGREGRKADEGDGVAKVGEIHEKWPPVCS